MKPKVGSGGRGRRSVTRGADFLSRTGKAAVDEAQEAAEDNEKSSVEVVPWSKFLPRFRRQWKQGEHVMMVGPTGQGKTTLGRAILPIRQYVVVFVTKDRDPLLVELQEEDNYQKVKEFIGQPEVAPRQLLAPPLSKGKASMAHQREVFEDAMYQAFAAGGWCIYLDELRYVTDNLKLSQDVEFLLLQGRALKISLVAATQRPVKVPLEFFDQSTHLFIWRDNDETNRRRIGGIGGVSGATLWSEVAELGQYEFIYLNTRTGSICKSKVEL